MYNTPARDNPPAGQADTPSAPPRRDKWWKFEGSDSSAEDDNVEEQPSPHAPSPISKQVLGTVQVPKRKPVPPPSEHPGMRAEPTFAPRGMRPHPLVLARREEAEQAINMRRQRSLREARPATPHEPHASEQHYPLISLEEGQAREDARRADYYRRIAEQDRAQSARVHGFSHADSHPRSEPTRSRSVREYPPHPGYAPLIPLEEAQARREAEKAEYLRRHPRQVPENVPVPAASKPSGLKNLCSRKGEESATADAEVSRSEAPAPKPAKRRVVGSDKRVTTWGDFIDLSPSSGSDEARPPTPRPQAAAHGEKALPALPADRSTWVPRSREEILRLREDALRSLEGGRRDERRDRSAETVGAAHASRAPYQNPDYSETPTEEINRLGDLLHHGLGGDEQNGHREVEEGCSHEGHISYVVTSSPDEREFESWRYRETKPESASQESSPDRAREIWWRMEQESAGAIRAPGGGRWPASNDSRADGRRRP